MPDATERWTERVYGEELVDTRPVYTGTIYYDVINSRTEPDALAKLPVTIGSGHPVMGDLLTCNGRFPEQKGYNYWVVRCTFRSNTSGDLSQSIPEYHWDISATSEEVDRDAVGNPITNSFGDPPLNRPTNEFKILTLEWEQWEPKYSLRRAVNYVDCVNSDEVKVTGNNGWEDEVFQPGEIYLARYAPAGNYRMGQAPLKMAYEIHFRARIEISEGNAISAWDWRFRDMGNRGLAYASGSSGSKMPDAFYNSRGEELIEPVPLDGDGTPIDTNILVGKDGLTPIAKEKPKGCLIDNRFKPDAVFLCWQKKLAQPFKNLVSIFQ